jgi:uncharacterized protein with FMN-binding domain
MKTPKPHQIVPLILAGAAAAIPVGTAVEMLTHVSSASGTTLLPPAPTAASIAPTAVPTRVAAPTATTVPTRVATPAATPTPSSRTYRGPVVDDGHGQVQAIIAVTGKRIVNVAISAVGDEPRSDDINSQAVPILQSETLTAQSASINGVSGATDTSQAYAQSLQAALDQARI